MIHHPVDDDSRDGHVEPDWKGDPGDSPVFCETLAKRQEKGSQHEGYEANGEKGMGREHQIAMFLALAPTNCRERGQEQNRAQRVQTRNDDGDPFEQRNFSRLG